MIAAIFDCDGTLYSAQFGRGLLRYVDSQGFHSRVRAYYATLLPRYLLRKLRLISEEELNRPVIANLSRLVAGWDLGTADAAFRWVAHEFLLPTRRPAVLSRLQAHQHDHHLVIILSGVFQPCLEMIGAELGVGHVLGTRIEARDGRYSGRIVPPIVTGSDKLPLLKEFVAARRLDVDWTASYAYADSIHDHQILEAVGNPIAVHPDSELMALAQERSWPVVAGQ